MLTNTTSSRVYRYCFYGCEGASLDAALITDSALQQAAASEQTRIDDPYMRKATGPRCIRQHQVLGGRFAIRCRLGCEVLFAAALPYRPMLILTAHYGSVAYRKLGS